MQTAKTWDLTEEVEVLVLFFLLAGWMKSWGHQELLWRMILKERKVSEVRIILYFVIFWVITSWTKNLVAWLPTVSSWAKLILHPQAYIIIIRSSISASFSLLLRRTCFFFFFIIKFVFTVTGRTPNPQNRITDSSVRANSEFLRNACVVLNIDQEYKQTPNIFVSRLKQKYANSSCQNVDTIRLNLSWPLACSH